MTPIYITQQTMSLDAFEKHAADAGFVVTRANRATYVSVDLFDDLGECVVWRAFENDGNDGHPHIESSGWHPRLELEVWHEGDPEYRVLVGDIDEFMADEAGDYEPAELEDLFMRVGVEMP